MFTIATALTRLSSGTKNLFINSNGTLSAPQQLQLINEILDSWYEEESWRGVRGVVALTSVSGIISLPAAYLRVDERINVTSDGNKGAFFEIKPLEYMSQPGGPGYFDVTEGCLGVAIDLGDNASGVRRYQLTGDATVLDTYTYSAVARLRYVWATDTATVVVPDCFSALELSVRARNAADELANELSKDLWAQAYAKLDANIGQFNEGTDMGSMQIDPQCAVNICNLV